MWYHIHWFLLWIVIRFDFVSLFHTDYIFALFIVSRYVWSIFIVEIIMLSWYISVGDRMVVPMFSAPFVLRTQNKELSSYIQFLLFYRYWRIFIFMTYYSLASSERIYMDNFDMTSVSCLPMCNIIILCQSFCK